MDGDELERRLLNWGRWYWSAGLLGARSGALVSSIYRNGPRGRRADATMPVLDGEAIETDSAVDRIPSPCRDALRARYLCVGPTGAWLGGFKDEEVARRLGISERTFYRLLVDGRCHLVNELMAARRRREAALFDGPSRGKCAQSA